MKICTKCLIEKDYSNFTTRKISKDGFRNICKSCVNKKQNDRYANNETVRIKKKIYEENNINIIKIQRTAYNKNKWAKNKEELSKENKEYYHSNRETILDQKKKYLAKNKESINSKRNNRRYIKRDDINLSKRLAYQMDSTEIRRSATISGSKRRALKRTSEDGTINNRSLEELFSKQNGKCFYCNCILDFKIKRFVHLDHYVPISKGGKHTIDNVVYSCQMCNLTKNAKMPDVMLIKNETV